MARLFWVVISIDEATVFSSVLAFLCGCWWFSQIHGFGSIDLKSLQAENLGNVLPATSRSSNYIALKYCALPSDIRVRWLIYFLGWTLHDIWSFVTCNCW